MGIYKQGLNRKQQLMFPPNLDELVEEDNVVRAIEAYVDTLDIFKLNIKTKKSLIKDGQPAFHPKLLLKIYIYGYLNKIRSSRKLEQELNRNIEMMWLTEGLRPSYKTIANFRKNNPKALQTIFKEFSILFLVKTKKKVLGENALIMFTYNFRRLLNLIGIALFKKLCIAIKGNDLTQIREEIATYILRFGVYLIHFLERFLFLSNISKKMRYL